MAGSGLAATLAGCGYRPGAGDIRWQELRSFIGDVASRGTIGDAVVTVTESMSFGPEWGSNGRITAHAIDSGRTVLDGSLSDPLERAAIGEDSVAIVAGRTVAEYGLDGRRWDRSIETSVDGLAVSDGDVLVLTSEGVLLALSDGTERWRRDLEVEASASAPVGRPAAGDGAVVCALADRLVCFSSTGTRRWTRSGISPRRVQVEDRLVFVEGDFATTVLDLETGERQFGLSAEVEAVTSTTDGIYCLTRESLIAVDRSGTRRWERSAADIAGYENYQDVGTVDFDDRVAADAEAVFVTASDELFSLGPGDGSERWRVSNEDITDGPFCTGRYVVVLNGDEMSCHHREH